MYGCSQQDEGKGLMTGKSRILIDDFDYQLGKPFKFIALGN